MIIAFTVILVLLTLLNVRIKLTVMGYINLLGNALSCFTLRVWRIPVFSGSLGLRGSSILMKLKSGKEIQIKISGKKDDENSLASHLDNGFFAVADVSAVDYYLLLGKSDDAFMTAMLSAGARSVTDIALHLLRARYPRMKSIHMVEDAFDHDVLQLSVRGVLYMTGAELLYALLYAWKRKLRIRALLAKTARAQHQRARRKRTRAAVRADLIRHTKQAKKKEIDYARDHA